MTKGLSRDALINDLRPSDTALLAAFIAMGLSANPNALAAIAASGSASDLTAGIVPDGILPSRLREVATTVTDFNAIAASGVYRGAGSATGAPVNNAGTVVHYAYGTTNAVQYWYQQSGTVAYQRSQISSIWSEWTPVYTSAQLDARYAQVAGPTTDKGQSLGTVARRYVNGYLSGTLTLGGASEAAPPNLVMNTVAGVSRWMRWRTGDVERWLVGADNTAENGSNSGSDFRLRAHSDAGGLNVDALVISRATGVVTFGASPKLPSYTVATLPAASAFAQCIAYVSNGASNKRLAVSDGTNWRFPDGAIVS